MLLEVHDLCVSYRATSGTLRPALGGVHLSLRAGEVAGILGESGCGKSTLAQALVGLLPPGGCVTRGKILFRGQNLLSRSEREMESIRGSQISLIFQEPSIALHPTMRVGEQIAQVIGAHNPFDRRVRRERTREVLSETFSSDIDRIYSSYPHQLSGGQQQRVLIAQAIACRPALVVADEPTASLDTTTQASILALFAGLRERLGLTLLLITHNPAILAGLADRIYVLYAGRVVEEGPADALLRAPQHPYLRGLLRSMPAPPEKSSRTRKARLPAIEGAAPELSAPPGGCSFEPRCEDRMPRCVEREPGGNLTTEDRRVYCFKYGEA